MILVTGASGFVGQHVLGALRRRFPGEPVRALDVTSPGEVAGADGVEFVLGSIEKPVEVERAVAGVRTTIHLAAYVKPGSREFDKMWRINVDGSRNVHCASVAAGCRQLIHLSSAGIYGPPRQAEPFREDDEPHPLSPYQRTKWEAEEELRRADSGDMVVNIVRPAGIYGPGSLLELPAYRRVLSRTWAVEMAGGVIVHPTHVDDIAQALVALVETPAPHGAIFNVGGQRPLRVAEWEMLVAHAAGVRRRRLVVPAAIMTPVLSAFEPLLGAVGRSNALRRGMSEGRVFSSAVDDRRFRQQYPDVPVRRLEDGLREHVEWARGQQLLPAAKP